MGTRSDSTLFAGIIIVTLLLTGVYTLHAWNLPGSDHGPTVAGFQMDFFITAATMALAGALFLVSVLAWRKDGRSRYLFVSGAFFLFMTEGFLLAAQSLTNKEWLEPVAHILNFGILLLFFAGLMTPTPQ